MGVVLRVRVLSTHFRGFKVQDCPQLAVQYQQAQSLGSGAACPCPISTFRGITGTELSLTGCTSRCSPLGLVLHVRVLSVHFRVLKVQSCSLLASPVHNRAQYLPMLETKRTGPGTYLCWKPKEQGPEPTSARNQQNRALYLPLMENR